MKIKRRLIWSLIGGIDPNIQFERIKKLYSNVKYFNPINKSYNGTSMGNSGALDGYKIENMISGNVMTIKNRDVSDKNIHLSINIEVYHIGLVYIENIYTLEDWSEELEKFDEIIIKSDKDESLVSPSGSAVKFVITELMCIQEVAGLDDEHYNYGSIDKREVNNIIFDKYGHFVNRIGTSVGPPARSWLRSPNLVLDEDEKISINPDKDKKVSEDFEIYDIKDKKIHLTKDKNIFDKMSDDTKKDFIKMAYLRHNQYIATTWLNEIQDKSKSVLESIDNKNEVYWQILRTEVEIWQLNFLRYHSTFYRYNTEFNAELTNDNVFDKEVYKEWNDDYKEDMQVITLCYNEIKYALENLATPGHTHDEQLLQHETEKGNERILLLSFLAMSIPMIGAILTPTLSLNLKLMSGTVILLLPVLYMLTRGITSRRNKNLNTKNYLKSEQKELQSKLKKFDAVIKQINKNEDLPEDLKKTFLNFVGQSSKSQNEKLDKMNKKIKSL